MASQHHPEVEKTLAALHPSTSPRAVAVLRDLHARALAESAFVSTANEIRDAKTMYVALDPDKCAFVYLMLRACGARYVVEAGTSFGVSTIYLALAVGQNVAAGAGGGDHVGSIEGGEGRVIATENEASKAAVARQNWEDAGIYDVARWIDLREGDLRETLKEGLPGQVDFLLLDSKCIPFPVY